MTLDYIEGIVQEFVNDNTGVITMVEGEDVKVNVSALCKMANRSVVEAIVHAEDTIRNILKELDSLSVIERSACEAAFHTTMCHGYNIDPFDTRFSEVRKEAKNE